MKTHYPSSYTKSILKREKVNYTDMGNSLCNTGNTGTRAAVTVTTEIHEVDCKRCLIMLKGHK